MTEGFHDVQTDRPITSQTLYTLRNWFHLNKTRDL